MENGDSRYDRDSLMRPAPSHPPFEQTVRVSSGDLDERNHVNNVVYVRWVQEIAIAHWRALAPPEDQATVAWVVIRHEIDYLAPALEGDKVILRTWVGKAQKLAFERFTEIVNAESGALLARGRTLWCPVATTSGRATRVSPEVRKRFSV